MTVRLRGPEARRHIFWAAVKFEIPMSIQRDLLFQMDVGFRSSTKLRKIFERCCFRRKWMQRNMRCSLVDLKHIGVLPDVAYDLHRFRERALAHLARSVANRKTRNIWWIKSWNWNSAAWTPPWLWRTDFTRVRYVYLCSPSHAFHWDVTKLRYSLAVSCFQSLYCITRLGLVNNVGIRSVQVYKCKLPIMTRHVHICTQESTRFTQILVRRH